jgi:hypothetical protein
MPSQVPIAGIRQDVFVMPAGEGVAVAEHADQSEAANSAMT